MISAGPSIKHLARFVNGYPFKPDDLGLEGYPIIRIRQLMDPEAEVNYAEPPTRAVWISDGDLVFSWSATLAVQVWDRGPALLNQHLYRVDPLPGVETNWLLYVLEVAVDRLKPLMHGSAMTHITQEMLWSITTALPSVATQRTVADFLDTETARIDALTTKKRRMIELLDQRDGVLIEAALSRAAVGDVPLRRLLLTLPKYGAGEAGVPGEGGWPRYIRITDLTDTGALCSEGILRLPPDVARPFLLEDGDLLLARSGATVGKAFLYRRWMGSAAFAGYLVQFRPDQEKVLPELLEAWTRTRHYWSQIRLASLQATIENVSAEKYKDFVVPLVPRNLQEEVLAEIGSRREKSRLARAALQRQVELLQEHRQALITAAVTGDLEVPGVAA